MTHHVMHAVDLVLTGGTIVTLDGDGAGARRGPTAIAIRGGRIAAIGSDEDIGHLAGRATRVVALRGRCLLPGFVDAHAHPLVEGIRASWLDLLDTAERGAALDRLSTAVRAGQASPSPYGEVPWIEATYHPARWPDNLDLTRAELDAAAPGIPVLIHHGSGHAVVASSAGLARAGITALRNDPPGATIERGPDGEPTGLVRGSDPVAPFAAALPPLTPEELRAAVRLVGTHLAADGVTSITDADLGTVGDPLGELAAYVGAALDGDLAVRLTVMPGLARLAGPDEAPPRPEDLAALVPPDAATRVRIGAAKFFADGALSTSDAWLRAPYADCTERDVAPMGRPARDPEEFVARSVHAHLAGWQIATHGIGDAGIQLALDAYDAALRQAPRPDHRHRVEHAMLLTGDLLDRMIGLEIVAVIQPEFVAETGDVYLSRLGAERAGLVYGYRRWLDAGLVMAFGTDRPITRGRPLDGIRSACRHAGRSGTRLAAGVAPTIVEGLRAWTATAAWAGRDEARVGRLEPGLAADLVVLDRDPTRVPAEAWATGEDGVTVVATMVDGVPVFGGEALD